MNNVIGAAPFPNLLGFKDESGGQPQVNPEALPTWLPLAYTFAQWGPTLPQLLDDTSVELLYGTSTFDPQSVYATHQTMLINTVLGAGGSIMVQRVVPSDAAPPATLGLYLDIVAEPALPQYQRNSDGSFFLDVNGDKVQLSGGAGHAAGYIAKWVVVPITDGLIGQATQVAGSFQNSLSAQSQLIPILEFRASFVGSMGNDLGVSIWAPTSNSYPPVNMNVIRNSAAYVYRLSFVNRSNPLSTPNVVRNQQGEVSVEFTFKAGVIDPVTEMPMNYHASVIPAYQQIDHPGEVNDYGPFQQMYVYTSNLNTVLTEIFAAEQPGGLVGGVSSKPYLINIFGATDPHGVPYHNFQLSGISDGGLVFAQGTNQYASGGSDGTMSFSAFDTAVRNQLLNWGNLEASLMDFAYYPLSVLVDSGFTLATKEAMLVPMGLRKDIAVILSTQDVSQAQNSSSAESSIAVALRTAANNYPESTFYGTPVCRAVIIGQSGYLLNSTWTGLLPLTLQYAARATAYMGAGNGIWKRAAAFDISPLNQINMFKGVNMSWKTQGARNDDWEVGLVTSLWFDRRSLFWPGIQTVYSDDSSTLNSAITMHAGVELEKVCQRVWARLTGEAALTDDQFITKSNKLIDSMTTNRFGNRFVIRPETYFTSADTAAGDRWSCKITIYAPNMRTIGTFTIVQQRIDRLPPVGVQRG